MNDMICRTKKLESPRFFILIEKRILKYCLLTSTPPPTTHTLAHPPTTPTHTVSLHVYLLEQSVGEGVGGGEGSRARQISSFIGNSGALSALKQIVHNSSSL